MRAAVVITAVIVVIGALISLVVELSGRGRRQ